MVEEVPILYWEISTQEEIKSLTNNSVLCVRDVCRAGLSIIHIFLYLQLQEVPEDFFVDIISCNNFLVASLTNLFSNIREYESCPNLKSKAISFENHLTKKFGWCFEDEYDDEYCPVVVDMWPPYVICTHESSTLFNKLWWSLGKS